MTGASTGTQTGRLVFTISRSGGATSVQMTPRLVATTQQYRENDSSTEKEEFPVKQGNPLPMKYGRLFAEMEKWQLEEPSRAAVFMNENTEAQTSPESSQQESKSARNKRPSTFAEKSEETTSQAEERPGDGGDDVEWVQTTLNNLGHACGPEDGVMGPDTRSCIRSFQKANDLEVTGKINEATYQKVLEKR